MRCCVAPSFSASRLQLGQTPLIAASSNGHVETVKALIEGRADLEAKDNVRMDGARIRRGGQCSTLISTCVCACVIACINMYPYTAVVYAASGLP